MSYAYGICPECGAPGVSRERRPNGNDQCTRGHVYPSREALDYQQMSGNALVKEIRDVIGWYERTVWKRGVPKGSKSELLKRAADEIERLTRLQPVDSSGKPVTQVAFNALVNQVDRVSMEMK